MGDLILEGYQINYGFPFMNPYWLFLMLALSFKYLSVAPSNLVNLITLTAKTALRESRIAWKAGRIERNLLTL